MAYRNSLKKCIHMMAYQLTTGNYPRMSIISNTAGKYYTLMTDEELLTEDNQPRKHKAHLCARLTLGELRQFAKQTQLALNLTEPPVDS